MFAVIQLFGVAVNHGAKRVNSLLMRRRGAGLRGSVPFFIKVPMDPVPSSPDVKKSLVLQPRLLIRGILRVIQRTQ